MKYATILVTSVLFLSFTPRANSQADQDELSVQLGELADRVQYLEDVMAIETLQSRYVQLLFTQDFGKIVECCFAQETDDISVEFSDSGVYKGKESVTRLYEAFEATRNIPGFFIMHLMVNPYIVIANDRQTARSSWLSPGATASSAGARWVWGPYYVDYVLEKGQWRINRTHFVPIFRNRYEYSWVEETDHGSVRGALTVQPDAPTTLYTPYDKTGTNLFKDHPELPEQY